MEERSEAKHEYYKGELFAMAGGQYLITELLVA
jgi:hypothetical protein